MKKELATVREALFTLRYRRLYYRIFTRGRVLYGETQAALLAACERRWMGCEKITLCHQIISYKPGFSCYAQR